MSQGTPQVVLFDDTNTVVSDWRDRVNAALRMGVPLQNIHFIVTDYGLSGEAEVVAVLKPSTSWPQWHQWALIELAVSFRRIRKTTPHQLTRVRGRVSGECEGGLPQRDEQ